MSIRQGNKIIANKTVPSIYVAGTNIEITDDNVINNTKTTYIHEQGIASDHWEIEHDLNCFPSVTIIDTSGVEVDCEVTYIDKNNCVLTMNAPFKGKAYLN